MIDETKGSRVGIARVGEGVTGPKPCWLKRHAEGVAIAVSICAAAAGLLVAVYFL